MNEKDTERHRIMRHVATDRTTPSRAMMIGSLIEHKLVLPQPTKLTLIERLALDEAVDAIDAWVTSYEKVACGNPNLATTHIHQLVAERYRPFVDRLKNLSLVADGAMSNESIVAAYEATLSQP